MVLNETGIVGNGKVSESNARIRWIEPSCAVSSAARTSGKRALKASWSNSASTC